MSRDRLNNLAIERRERLFETAAEEFIAQGYEKASLNRIIARSGMSKSSLYYYFNDKADLFKTLMETGLAMFIRDIGGFDLHTLTARTFWPSLEDLMLKVVIYGEKNLWYVRLGQLFYRLRARDRASKATSNMFKLAHGWLLQLLQHGQALGVVRLDLPEPIMIEAAMALAEVCDRYVVETWDSHDDAGRRRIVAQQLDLFRRLLSPGLPQQRH